MGFTKTDELSINTIRVLAVSYYWPSVFLALPRSGSGGGVVIWMEGQTATNLPDRYTFTHPYHHSNSPPYNRSKCQIAHFIPISRPMRPLMPTRVTPVPLCTFCYLPRPGCDET